MQVPVDTLDHDFPSAGSGKLIPHGPYDFVRNAGTMYLNTSHDNSELCCTSIAESPEILRIRQYMKRQLRCSS